jgi:putative transposase
MVPRLLDTAAAVIKSRQVLILENLALRHQLIVLQRNVKRPRMRDRDRILWSLLSRFWKEWRKPLLLVQPETVIRWHRGVPALLATEEPGTRAAQDPI